MSNVTYQAYVQALGAASALTGAELIALIQSGNPVQIALGSLGIALNSSSVPANGIYIPAANTLGFSTNSIQRGTVNANGNWAFNAASSGYTVTVNSNAGSAQIIQGGSGVSALIEYAGNANVAGTSSLAVGQTAAGVNTILGRNNAALQIGTNGTTAINITSGQAIQGLGPVAAGFVDMTPDTGTFTATGTGFTANPTGTATWVRVGKLVMLFLPTLSGTSNSTAFTVTGIPAAIQPVSSWNTTPINGEDNTAPAVILPSITGGTITMNKQGSGGTYSSSGFTAAGAKAISAGSMVCYILN